MKQNLLFGGFANVPESVGTCPECGSGLAVECIEWVEDTGKPAIGGLYIDCKADDKLTHRHYQSDWQEIIDAVENWCDAQEI